MQNTITIRHISFCCKYFIILSIQNISKKYYKNMNNKQLANNLDDGTKNCTPIANVTFCGTFFET